MTDECRAWLESYREAKLEAERLCSSIDKLWSRATNIVAQLSDMPRGGGCMSELKPCPFCGEIPNCYTVNSSGYGDVKC